MHLSSTVPMIVILVLVLACQGIASLESSIGRQQAILKSAGAKPVPGDNPLQLCQSENNYTLILDRVDLTPNPPVAGVELLVKGKGFFRESVERGAYVNLVVKYGYIVLIRQRFDLCEQMAQVDETCPLEGSVEIRKNVALPKEIPPGRYAVLADVYTKNAIPVICLQANVHF